MKINKTYYCIQISLIDKLQSLKWQVTQYYSNEISKNMFVYKYLKTVLMSEKTWPSNLVTWENTVTKKHQSSTLLWNEKIEKNQIETHFFVVLKRIALYKQKAKYVIHTCKDCIY